MFLIVSISKDADVRQKTGQLIRQIVRRTYLGYIGKRLLGFIPLLFGISIVTFILIRLLPGDPAQTLAGSSPYEGVVEGIREHMGLNEPIHIQYFIYLKNILHGDLGKSWFTGKPVIEDMVIRLPATIELITYGILGSVLVGFFLGISGAAHPNGIVDRSAQIYGLLAGALPDFWVALLVILVFFYFLRIIPAPFGRLPMLVDPPNTITGFLTIDSLLARDFVALKAAFAQLAAPVFTLVIIFAGGITKMTRSTMIDALHGPSVNYAHACGLPEKVILRYAFRKILPPIITLIGFTYAQMVGGVVLIEKVFSWNGVGRYAVQSIINKDYAPVQAFVLVAGLISLFVYLIVDVLYMIVDPRVRL